MQSPTQHSVSLHGVEFFANISGMGARLQWQRSLVRIRHPPRRRSSNTERGNVQAPVTDGRENARWYMSKTPSPSQNVQRTEVFTSRRHPTVIGAWLKPFCMTFKIEHNERDRLAKLCTERQNKKKSMRILLKVKCFKLFCWLSYFIYCCDTVPLKFPYQPCRILTPPPPLRSLLPKYWPWFPLGTI